MRSCKWVLSMLLIMSFLAFSSSSWADKKPKHQRDQQGWDDQWNKRDGDHPPGWDKGKKTGWQGNDLPPGQEKKKHRSYKRKPKFEDKNDWRHDDHRPPMTPVPVPVPVPAPR
jgi:hypothetical protein